MFIFQTTSNTRVMKNYLAVPLGLLIAFSFADCTNTVVETVIVHDTIPSGPAMVRFISMMSDGSDFNLKLTSSVDAPVFASTLTVSKTTYLPLVPDSDVHYYCFSAKTGKLLDSIPIAGSVLKDASVNSFALFYHDSTPTSPPRMQFAGGGNNDSGKYRPVHQGYAKLRLINGVRSYPASRAIVNIDIDTVTNTLTAVAEPEMSDYMPVQTGNHKLIISDIETQEVLWSGFQIFDQGGFYTARYIGVHGDTTRPDRLIVDTQ